MILQRWTLLPRLAGNRNDTQPRYWPLSDSRRNARSGIADGGHRVAACLRHNRLARVVDRLRALMVARHEARKHSGREWISSWRDIVVASAGASRLCVPLLRRRRVRRHQLACSGRLQWLPPPLLPTALAVGVLCLLSQGLSRLEVSRRCAASMGMDLEAERRRR